MMIKTPHFIFILSLMFGTVMACTSSSWILAWLGLEINLMSFIPILINKLKISSVEMAIKYFLIQAMASMILIFSSIFMNSSFPWSMFTEINLLVTLALSMKAGVAPLHFWFPQVMEYAQWFQALLILTWQKIAPLLLISFSFNTLTYLIIISSSIVGLIGGMNQASLKKILTYSSIMHSAWLILISFISDLMWWNYFLIYSLLVISVIIPLSPLNLNSINSINFLKLKLSSKMFIFLNILSLAGLPPFAGFFIKLMSINLMAYSDINVLIILILISSSLVAFYFYMRMMYTTLLMNSSVNKIIYFPQKMNKLIFWVILLSFMGNLFISFLVLLF